MPSEREGYACHCHRQMGSDFWFLPKDQCLLGKRCMRDEHLDATTLAQYEGRPFRWTDNKLANFVKDMIGG